MPVGWWKFRQRSANERGGAPDTAVAQGRVWLIRAALLASTVALLGTSQEADPVPSDASQFPTLQATYHFARGVEGDGVDLTSDRPSASFLVTLRTTELGPEGVVTVGEALVNITAKLSSSETEGVVGVSMRLAPDGPEHFTQELTATHSLAFGGLCNEPSENAPCQAAFSVDFARGDEGEQGGTVHVDWSFVLTSIGRINSTMGGDYFDQDPPWTVEITPQ